MTGLSGARSRWNKMKISKYLPIKKAYDKLLNDFLSSGRIPSKDTGIGFWAISITDDLFTLFQKIKLNQYKSFIDLGSGDGRAAHVASLFTKSTGIEYDLELHEHAEKIKSSLGLDTELINKNFLEHDISGYDVVFLNPDQRLHKLEPKLLSELKGDLILYGAEFHPKSLAHVKTFTANTTPVTIYRKS